MSDWKERETDKAQSLSRDISNFVNGLSEEYRNNEFVKAMGRQHSTIQQGFSRLCYAWLKFQSEQYKEKKYDLRNEQACKVAHKIMSHDDFKYETILPLI